MTKKKPEPNPIEEAIGDRAKPKTLKNPPIPQNPSEIPDEPSPSEMLSLEELNRRTEARLQETWPEEPTIPVSKPDLQPVTKTSSQESPPQEIKGVLPPDSFDAAHAENCQKVPTVSSVQDEIKKHSELFKPAEDVELTALKKYIREDGFVLSTVAFHIVTLCAQPLVTPSTTTWDFAERAEIPAMVLALLNQPGYLDGIWPSLRIVMGSNKGNQAWCAGIATTIAFFDVVRTLPAIEELKNEQL